MKTNQPTQPYLPGLQPELRVDWIEVANRMPPVPGDDDYDFDDDGRSPMGLSIYDCA